MAVTRDVAITWVRVALVRVVREKFVLLKLRKKGASLSGQEMGEESSHMILIVLAVVLMQVMFTNK